MIGRHSRGLLGVVAMLAAFGLEGPPPPKPEVNLGEAEKVMDELHAAGINSLEVMEAAGDPSKFVETARRCLDAQPLLAAMGEPGVTDVGRLLAPSKAIERDEALESAALARVIDDLPTFHGRPLARRLPDGSITSTRPTIDEARRDPDAFARYVMSDHHPAMTSRPHGPVDFKRAGEESRARRAIRRTFHSPTASDIAAAKRIEAALHPAGRCTCEGAGAGDCDWCVMNRRREAREHRADLRDAQAAGRKTSARKKARRGW